MKLTVKTDILKEMVGKSIKGASQNKLIPLTGLMAIQLKDNKLTLITTDATNYLYIMHDNIVGDEFYVVTLIEQFAKLISRLTCESTTLEVENSVLTVIGNGEYKIELPIDENGDLIIFPDPMAKEKTDGKDVNLATIKLILSAIKPALAVTMEVPVYTRYYVGERVVATDSYKISSLNSNVLDHDPILISPEFMNLLDIMTCEKIQFHQNKDAIIFASPDCIVYGHAMEGIEDYQIKEISEVIDEDMDSSCKLNRNALIAALDRISLFVGQFDNKTIILTFNEKGLDISSKTSTGVESLDYIESNNFKPYTCKMDIETMSQQIKASPADAVLIQYGNDNGLKIVDGNITQIICLNDDEAAAI